MPDRERLHRAAELIAEARRHGVPLPRRDPDHRPASLSEGYAVQGIVHDLLAPHFGPLAGYKIGCTSSVMQNYLSIPEPCIGGIYEHSVHRSGSILAFDRYVRVGVECEIAVRMASDLPAPARPSTRETVGDAVEAVYPAIEIVDDRYAGGWQGFGAPLLVADDFFAAGIVLGEPVRATGLDLGQVQGRALINGVEVGRGTGADLLGHPFNALAWLTNTLSSRGEHLKRGQIVMLGSVVQTVWVERGDMARMEFSHLGAVETAFR